MELIKDKAEVMASEIAKESNLNPYETCMKSTFYSAFGILLIVVICFFVMSISALLILSQMPETEWIIKSLVRSF